ncbi:MAG: DUF3644 domain-containing protein [Deltaproteobacteria bacterium]|nr:DUF3644 domain-containing protein [Deltaproteobacteria bacterium]
MALELYNRPSLQNRLDAFAQLFCTAWEQLLKAELLDQEGEEAIFKEQKEGRRRESISIDACIKKLMPNSKDFIRRNLERIVELRHEATHLLMEETALPISQLFQAGVLNFAKRFKASTGEALLPESSAGLLSLVGHVGMQNAVDMKKLYGEVVGADIEGLRNELDREIDEVNDQRFAVTIEYKLALVKKAGEGDISLSSATGSETILGVIEKSVLRETSHPHLTKDVINAVEIRLGTKFTSYDFTAILQKEKWKNGNNQYHSVGKKLTTHLYSDACIDEIISKVTQESDYLSAVRQSYRKFLKRKR